MKKTSRFLFFLLGLMTCKTLCYAQVDLSVSTLPVTLITNADAVVRYDATNFEIESKDQAVSHHRKVVTVLNEKGEDNHSQLVVGYDKFTKISNIEGAIYDQNGKLLKKLKSSDIKDYGYGSSSDMITDARWKVAEFGKKSYPYPYTIEFSYDTRDKNMMFYPNWTPVDDARTSVEYSEFKIKVPANLQLRYKILNSVPEVQKTTDRDNATLYTWSMKNLPPNKDEDYSLPGLLSYPAVLTAPSEFEVQNYSGNFTSWEDLGKFYYTLNKDRDVIPENVSKQLKELVSKASTDQEKVRLIYEWMQAKTRYVSIQLGIGGWQTIDATTVVNKGYGDCKALTNYTISLLKQVGITSYAALIKAGSGQQIIPDFPSNQFNHVIACVPLAKDTLWLECTSQVNSFNYLGSFTGNRHALLVTPTGGKLVKTTNYTTTDNSRYRVTKLKLEEQGDATAVVTTTYRGIQQETPAGLITQKNAEEQRKWIVSDLSTAGLDLNQFQLALQKGTLPAVNESLDLFIRQFATKTGSRLFIKANFLMREFDATAGSSTRTSDFFLNPDDYNFTDSDSLIVEFPSKLKLETPPAPIKVQSKFGTYETSFSTQNTTAIYHRKVAITGGRFPASDYKEWTDFLKKIRRSDRTQLVLTEKKE